MDKSRNTTVAAKRTHAKNVSTKNVSTKNVSTKKVSTKSAPRAKTTVGRSAQSERLSRRKRQPGHDRSFEKSESLFADTARKFLDAGRYRVTEKPKELRDLFPGVDGGRALGIVPEVCIENIATGRKVFVEVKKQRAGGNAEERACKHHTTRFMKALNERYGYSYHPFVTILCDELATNPRYTQKIPYYIEPEHYLLWKDYDEQRLGDYLLGICARWLD